MTQTVSLPHPTPDQLAEVPLLAALTEPQRRDLARHFDVEEVRAGQVLVREGSYGYAFYVLASGAAEVRHAGEVVAHLGARDFFGELALLGDGHRHASVVATEQGAVWTLFGTMFRQLEAEHPDIAAVIDQAAAARS